MKAISKEPVISIGLSLGMLLLCSVYWILCEYPLLTIVCAAVNCHVTLLSLINKCPGATAISLFGGSFIGFGVYVHAVDWTFGPGYSARLFEGKDLLPVFSVTQAWLRLANSSICAGFVLYVIAIVISIKFRSRHPWF